MSYSTSDNKYYGYIYMISNTENDKLYIGQTRRNLNIRWRQHLLSSKNEKENYTLLYRAMNKYGCDKFNIHLIKEYSFDSKDELIKTLNQEEIRYISEYNSVKPNGYNMQLGGKSPTESLKCPVDKYSTDGKFINSYESFSDACLDSDENLNPRHISECCKGLLYTSGGYVWRFKGDPFDKYGTKDRRCAPVDVYTKNGDFINHYETFMDAIYEILGSTDHHKYSSHITSCCKGERKSAYGYVWRYAGEPFEKYSNITVKR